uniref:Uncharacterized protein n=1 Tax=Bicosoecida sp. CB-2014 TaxID=1486930 RepID=A0A7S1CPA6_9STRA
MGGSQSAAKPGAAGAAAPREAVSVQVAPTIGVSSQRDDMQRQAAEIYQKGAEDGIRTKWDEMRRQADERVKAEHSRLASRVSDLMEEFESKHKRAPQREVACTDQREAIVACLARETDPLKCADAAAAFQACAEGVTGRLMKRGALGGAQS